MKNYEGFYFIFYIIYFNISMNDHPLQSTVIEVKFIQHLILLVLLSPSLIICIVLWNIWIIPLVWLAFTNRREPNWSHLFDSQVFPLGFFHHFDFKEGIFNTIFNVCEIVYFCFVLFVNSVDYFAETFEKLMVVAFGALVCLFNHTLSWSLVWRFSVSFYQPLNLYKTPSLHTLLVSKPSDFQSGLVQYDQNLQ